MAVNKYRDKRFLIIDSVKPSRDLLKQFAFNLDPEVVEASGYTKDIMLRCAENHYDVLLLGYDLGESQKNGQQLLEELRENGLVNRQSVVILITAENSQAMVLAALEHKPDDYLTKPYRPKDLLQRLDRCYNKKRHMKDIYQALDAQDSEAAIALCDRAIERNTPYVTECFGIKSRQLFEQNQFKQAAKIYHQFKSVRNCQWASIGLGKIALREQDYSTAINYFSELVDKHPLYLASYDWLATSYETIEQYTKAQDILESALNISPLSVKRLERFAKLCFDTGNYEKATRAFEQNYQLSFNSIHHKADNAFNFSEALNQLAPELSEHDLKVKKNRVINALHETSKTFNQADVRVQSNLHTARLMLKSHGEYDAKQLLSRTEKYIHSVTEQLESSSMISISKLLIDLNRNETANELIIQVVEREPDNIELMAQIDMIVDGSVQKDEQAIAQQALNQASAYFRQNHYQQALAGLSAAQSLYPQHIGIKLNLIQALLACHKQQNDEAKLVKAGELLASLVGLPDSHPAHHRYQILNEHYHSFK
ncbi:response regulator [Thalassotalea euphylliae]|uniref:Response regulator n=1 Tax=Thalassotalea euphylliae TaxID=1655234 RepID=A0A3E0UAC9_9GAMM|nr:response regulator [Thalassotalea euphylliae]REL33896.1 response regulator [Thalassotalea euphylliae]